MISSSQSRVSCPSGARCSSSACTLREYSIDAWYGIVDGRFVEADERHVLADGDLAGHGELAVAAGLGGEVDDDRARPHRLHRGRGDDLRRGAPGDGGGGDDDVELARCALRARPAAPSSPRASARARSRPRASAPATPRSSQFAPRLSICSRTAGRTSKPVTTAPRRRAVAIACRPATPAPMTSTFAGGTVPAAVMSIGKKRGSCSAASSAAL